MYSTRSIGIPPPGSAQRDAPALRTDGTHAPLHFGQGPVPWVFDGAAFVEQSAQLGRDELGAIGGIIDELAGVSGFDTHGKVADLMGTIGASLRRRDALRFLETASICQMGLASMQAIVEALIEARPSE